jgi:hypothetical protein
MKLSEARDAYETLSGKASEIARQLSLAGIAVIWVFKSGTDQAPSIDQHLLRAALFIALALSFDFLQYLVGTTIWFVYFRKKEKEGKRLDGEPQAPAWFNWGFRASAGRCQGTDHSRTTSLGKPFLYWFLLRFGGDGNFSRYFAAHASLLRRPKQTSGISWLLIRSRALLLLAPANVGQAGSGYSTWSAEFASRRLPLRGLRHHFKAIAP